MCVFLFSLGGNTRTKKRQVTAGMCKAWLHLDIPKGLWQLLYFPEKSTDAKRCIFELNSTCSIALINTSSSAAAPLPGGDSVKELDSPHLSVNQSFVLFCSQLYRCDGLDHWFPFQNKLEGTCTIQVSAQLSLAMLTSAFLTEHVFGICIQTKDFIRTLEALTNQLFTLL